MSKGTSSPASGSGGTPAACTTGTCPLEDKIALVELVEVVVHAGKESTRAPSARKQYVNMDDTFDPANPHPEYGRRIRLKARVEWVAGDKTRPLKGKKVYWYFQAGAKNRAGLTGKAKESFDALDAKKTKLDKETDDKGWTPVIDFYVSQYGGDEFTVFATDDASYKGGKSAGAYTVWRKLFYDIVEMKTKDGTAKYEMKGAIVSRVKAGYDKAYIEMQDTGKRHLGDYVDNFDTVEKGFVWADKYCAADSVPLKVHFSVIDHAAPRSGTYGATTEVVQEEADKTPFTSSGKIRPYDFTGHTWLLKAQYEDRTDPAKVEWKDFGAGKVTLDGARGRRKFKADFSGATVTPTAAKKVKVKLQYLQPGSYGGWGGSNSLHLLICRGEYEDLMTVAQADAQIIVACLHEPGHALGLVPASAGWHDASHSGHCSFNTCTMWFASSPGNEAFHDESVGDPGCRTTLREKELTKAVLQPMWKFPR